MRLSNQKLFVWILYTYISKCHILILVSFPSYFIKLFSTLFYCKDHSPWIYSDFRYIWDIWPWFLKKALNENRLISVHCSVDSWFLIQRTRNFSDWDTTFLSDISRNVFQWHVSVVITSWDIPIWIPNILILIFRFQNSKL